MRIPASTPDDINTMSKANGFDPFLIVDNTARKTDEAEKTLQYVLLPVFRRGEVA